MIDNRDRYLAQTDSAFPLSQFFSYPYRCSLTLSISGIGKEIVTLFLDSRINGTRMSTLNVLGLCVCLNGIALHVYHKWKSSSSTSRLNPDLDVDDDNGGYFEGEANEKTCGDGERWIELSEIKSWERRKERVTLSLGGGCSGGGGDESELKQPLMSTSQTVQKAFSSVLNQTSHVFVLTVPDLFPSIGIIFEHGLTLAEIRSYFRAYYMSNVC